MKEQGATFPEIKRAARLLLKACIEIQGQTSCFLAKGAGTHEKTMHQFSDPLVSRLSQMLLLCALNQRFNSSEPWLIICEKRVRKPPLFYPQSD